MKVYQLAVSAAFSVFAAPVVADTTISLEQRTGSIFLSGPNGKGTTTALRLETSNGSGLLALRLGQIHDQSGNMPLNKSLEIGGLATLTAQASWYKQVDAQFMQLEKSFRVLGSIDLSYGFYAGTAIGRAGHMANVHLHINPLSLTLPSYSYKGYGTPALNLSMAARDYALYSDTENRQAKSPYGGLIFASDMPVNLSSHTQLRLTKSAQIGADRMGYGGGAALVYASQPLTDDRQMPDGPCQGRPYAPKQGFALTAALCMDKTVKSTMHEAEERKAQRYANTLNAYGSQINGYAGQLCDRTSYCKSLPTYTAKDVMNALGLPDPTAKAQIAVRLGVAGSYGPLTYALEGSIPLSGIKNRQLGASMGYRF